MSFWSADGEDADLDLADRLRASLDDAGTSSYSASPDDMASFMSMGMGGASVPEFNFDSAPVEQAEQAPVQTEAVSEPAVQSEPVQETQVDSVEQSDDSSSDGQSDQPAVG